MHSSVSGTLEFPCSDRAHSVARRSCELVAWEVLFVVLLGEVHHCPALHLLLEKALVVSHGTYLQIPCSLVDNLLLAHLKAFSPG